LIRLISFKFRLRDLSLTKQAENETLKKQSEILEHKLKVLTKENENVKTDVTTMQATIADLKEQVRSINLVFFSLLDFPFIQVDTCLGAQQMVDILTTKNLSLEDQVRELQESADTLVSFIQ
jgi:hypothetical protein